MNISGQYMAFKREKIVLSRKEKPMKRNKWTPRIKANRNHTAVGNDIPDQDRDDQTNELLQYIFRFLVVLVIASIVALVGIAWIIFLMTENL